MPKYAVYIGRFQPFHTGHHEVLKHTLARYDRIIVVVGSARQARSPKNPFTADERIALIRSTLSPDDQRRVQFVQVRDYMYNDNMWLTDVQRSVKAIVDVDPGPVSIVGRLKDRTSFYIRMFPQWTCDEYQNRHPMDATDVRKALFEHSPIEHLVPPAVNDAVNQWVMNKPGVISQNPDHAFNWLCEEYKHYKEYKAQWANSPFPPVFVTVDAVVVQSGHILLIRRGDNPGKGLLALPGGFIHQFEPIEDAMLRELKEETNLLIPRDALKKSIVAQKVFDHPDRSLRGRTISHGFCIQLYDGDLAEVKGADDADKAFWLPLADVSNVEDQFFDDHVHIIRYFTTRF